VAMLSRRRRYCQASATAVADAWQARRLNEICAHVELPQPPRRQTTPAACLSQCLVATYAADPATPSPINQPTRWQGMDPPQSIQVASTLRCLGGRVRRVWQSADGGTPLLPQHHAGGVELREAALDVEAAGLRAHQRQPMCSSQLPKQRAPLPLCRAESHDCRGGIGRHLHARKHAHARAVPSHPG
jgi:hypothetical protein